VLVVTADHGENLGEHGSEHIGRHSGYFNTSLAIPLIVTGGKEKAGSSIDYLTGHDMVPELILGLVDGLPGDGRLQKAIHRAYSAPYLVAYDDSVKAVVGVPRDPTLVSLDPSYRTKAFLWREDPFDRAPGADTRASHLVEELERLRIDFYTRGALAEPASLDPDKEESLRALGYIE